MLDSQYRDRSRGYTDNTETGEVLDSKYRDRSRGYTDNTETGVGVRQSIQRQE